MQNKQVIKVVLAGQPNVGKSSLINAISNAKLKVGNFSGVTVEKEVVVLEYKNYKIEMTDLPGAYSLTDYTLEERVAKDFLKNEEYDLILNIVDSTSLERNFYLTSELLALDKKMIIALNMTDEAKKENIEINERILSQIIGKPCIKTSATSKLGIDNLLNAIIKKFNSRKLETKLIYSDAVEEEIENIVKFLADSKYMSKDTYRQTAISLLREDKKNYRSFSKEPIWPRLQIVINEALQHIFLHYNSKSTVDIFNEEKFAFAKGACKEAVVEENKKSKTFSEKLDSILMNKFLGLPIFLFFMWGLFQLTFEIGSIPMDWIDAFFGALGDNIIEILGEGEMTSLLVDGIIGGVGAVVLFLPNIMILFFGIALLETTGYMSRVAFLLDGFFHNFGLHGKSFIPLVTGFGCSVPAYMATRTLKNEKDRLITLFIIGFMSCGARLPIYVLFVGAFCSSDNAGNMLFLIYIAGAFLGLIAAKILKLTAFKGEEEPFVMEIPKYRIPMTKLVWHTVYTKSLMYLKKAGTFILAASVLIWFASTYPKHPEIEEQYSVKIENAASSEIKKKLENKLALEKLENSYLGYIGKASEPFFRPLGMDWRMAVSLETGLAAKEVVVSTLSILYGLGEDNDESSDGLMASIKENITLPAAISFILFVMIYIPCLASMMVFVREAGSWKYLWYLVLFTTTSAWVVSFIGYNITKFIV